MASSEERMKILKMVEDGKISAEDGAKLLAALSNGNGASAAASSAQTSYTNVKSASGAKWFRIRVTDMVIELGGKSRVREHEIPEEGNWTYDVEITSRQREEGK